MNTPSWIVLGILIAVVGIILFFLILNKKKGKGRCSCCNSGDCPHCKK